MLDKKNEHSYQWYIISVVGGKEDLVIDNLRKKIIALKLNDIVKDIKVIKERVVDVKLFNPDEAPKRMINTAKIKWESIMDSDGKVIQYKRTKTEEKNKFPGYIFMKMFIDYDLWFTIRNTELVTGLIGSYGKNSQPIPVGENEINAILNGKTENNIVTNNENTIITQKEFYECDFEVGDYVIITNGGMKDQKGVVTNINNQKGITTIQIDMLGQIQEIIVDFKDVLKINE